MERQKFEQIASEAAQQRGCVLAEILFNDDDNIFELTLDKEGGADLEDCEAVHRAILSAFDRDIEDYSLTVGSAGISAEEADEILKTVKE
jgi:ribosome maturation factor RimP